MNKFKVVILPCIRCAECVTIGMAQEWEDAGWQVRLYHEKQYHHDVHFYRVPEREDSED
jgi:hypothetical protein